MRGMLIAGVVLLAVGITALVVERVSFTTEEQVLKIGPIEATAERERTVAIPTLAGIGLLALGGVLTVVGLRRR